MSEPASLERIIQALLLSCNAPLSGRKIVALLADFGYAAADVEQALANIQQQDIAPLELVEVASGYRLQIQAQYSRFSARLLKERSTKYPKSVLETLAIIAYKQPITRAEIENIRGVNSGSRVYQALFERGWIKVAGRKDSPGRPELLVTSKDFLDHFGLQNLSQLPEVAVADDGENLGFEE